MNIMKKIFVIVGESGSGKDTLVNRICNEYPELSQTISYTNRPKRDNETNGVEHYFLTDKEFKKKRYEAGDRVVAYTKIASDENKDGYEYMATLDEVQNSTFYIIDPKGLEYFRTHFGDKFDIITIYIYSPYNQREKRAQKRSDFNSSFHKRWNAEKYQFNKFYRRKEYDYIIYNLDGLQEESYKTFVAIVNFELCERDKKSEFTAVMGEEYKKEDLIETITYIRTLGEFYKKCHLNDNSLVREVTEKTQLIRNVVLSYIR